MRSSPAPDHFHTGLGSVKEEPFAIENDLLRRRMATPTIDGPGQGGNAPRFPIRPDRAALNLLMRGSYISSTRSRDKPEALEQAEPIAREAPKATLVLDPDGNHVCNNKPYRDRRAMADWMRERMGTVGRPPTTGRVKPPARRARSRE